MRTIDPARWDDYILGGLILIVALPRAILAVMAHHSLGAEDTLAMLLTPLALVILAPRRR